MATTLSPEDAAQLRTYERQRHDALSEGYIGFFAPVTALAIAPLLEAVRLRAGHAPAGCAERLRERSPPKPRAAARRSSASISRSGMVASARKLHPGIDFRVGDVDHLPVRGRHARRGRVRLRHRAFPLPGGLRCGMHAHAQAGRARSRSRGGTLPTSSASKGSSATRSPRSAPSRRRSCRPATRACGSPTSTSSGACSTERARRHHAAGPQCHASGGGRRRAVERRG